MNNAVKEMIVRETIRQACGDLSEFEFERQNARLSLYIELFGSLEIADTLVSAGVPDKHWPDRVFSAPKKGVL